MESGTLATYRKKTPHYLAVSDLLSIFASLILTELMAKDEDNTRNNLIINKLPTTIREGKENDYTYSVNLTRLLRRFVRLAAPDPEQLSKSDAALLEDVLRYGRLQKVAEKRGRSNAYVSNHVSRALALLEKRVLQWEVAQVRAIEEKKSEELERELNATRQRIAEIEQRLERVRNNSVDFNRFYALTTARLKTMEAETFLREHSKT